MPRTCPSILANRSLMCFSCSARSAIAGALVLIGVLGSLLVWQPLLYLALFVGAGLLFAGLTDTCMLGLLLLRLPYNRAATCDAAGVLARLRERPL